MFKPPQQSKSLPTLHLSFMASTVIYGIVAYLLKTQVMFDDPGFVGLDAITYTLFLYGAMAASVFLAVFALVILPQPKLRDRIVPRLTVLKENTPQAQHYAFHILRVAVIEAIAILGLSLFFLNGNLTHLWWFLGAALTLLILIFPTGQG